MKETSFTKELEKWVKLITDEVNNPLTVGIEMSRSIDYDKSYPYPLSTLTIKVKQKEYDEQ